MRRYINLPLLALAGALSVVSARANIMLNFYPVSDYNANTAAMDATLGITGDTIDSFESTSLISGLSISISNGVPSTTWTSLPGLFNESYCGAATPNTAWDGPNVVSNATGNLTNSCATPSNVANTITFDYAPGATQLGIGMSNFQSLSTPPGQYPITNHELYVNGIDMGVLETLAGANWSPGLSKNGYLVIDGTGGTTITSVGFVNINTSTPDIMLFDHLAVNSSSTVPEPESAGLVILGIAALMALHLQWNSNPSAVKRAQP